MRSRRLKTWPRHGWRARAAAARPRRLRPTTRAENRFAKTSKSSKFECRRFRELRTRLVSHTRSTGDSDHVRLAAGQNAYEGSQVRIFYRWRVITKYRYALARSRCRHLGRCDARGGGPGPRGVHDTDRTRECGLKDPRLRATDRLPAGIAHPPHDQLTHITRLCDKATAQLQRAIPRSIHAIITCGPVSMGISGGRCRGGETCRPSRRDAAHLYRMDMPDVCCFASSSEMFWLSPANSLSLVKNSMQWHSCRSRIGTHGQFQ